MKKIKEDDYPFIAAMFYYICEKFDNNYMLLTAAEQKYKQVSDNDNIEADDVNDVASLFELSGFLFGYVTAVKVMQGKIL